MARSSQVRISTAVFASYADNRSKGGTSPARVQFPCDDRRQKSQDFTNKGKLYHSTNTKIGKVKDAFSRFKRRNDGNRHSEGLLG